MENVSVPRILISSAGSSAGKTTVMCALLGAIPDAAAIKCGPDFIDPLFHQKVLGRATGNIDLFFTEPSVARGIFAHDAEGARIVLCEGAMGFYDGAGGTEKASAYEAARDLGCPVILVVDAKGKSLSVCAEINGFAAFREKDGDRSGICGVILNRATEAVYESLAPQIERECGVRALGYLEDCADFAIESRHLGLVTPDAVQGLREKMKKLSAAAKKSFEIEEIVRIAQGAPVLEYENLFASCQTFSGDMDGMAERKQTVRIAVARDEAFCFYYRENLELLEAMGAELVEFSPLHDRLIPAGCHALYVGGGYPELFPIDLAGNTTMLQSVRQFCRRGAPVFAECGGFLYLQLAGVLAGTFENRRKLVRFGYVTLTANEDTILCRAGDKIRGHEFHYFDTTENGSAFTAEKLNGKSWRCMVSAVPVADMHDAPCRKAAGKKPTVLAGFPHLYFPGNPQFAKNFVEAARDFAEGKRSDCAGCGGCLSGNGCGGCVKNGGKFGDNPPILTV